MAQQLYQLWSSQGGGAQDFSAIIKLLHKPAANQRNRP
jgi:3-hydroxyisobutyrate dehydrogenase-like beta-hydroxyacid dehydrogenase